MEDLLKLQFTERIRSLYGVSPRIALGARAAAQSGKKTEHQQKPTTRWEMPSHDWLIWALISAVFAALTAIFAKVGLGGIDADFATLVRTVVIVLVLAVFVVAAGKWHDPRTLSAKAVGFLVLSALATGASWVCYFRALKLGDAAKVAPVDKLSVILVAIFAAVFLHERPSLGQWLGIGLVGMGVIIISLNR